MDHMIRGYIKDRPIRFFAVNGAETVEEMRRIHGTSPNASAACGRSLMATAMIGYDMKNDTDVVTTIIDGDGEIGKITCTADNRGNVKLDVLNPDTGIYINENEKLDVGRVVGGGTLRVIKDIGLREPYVGQTDLVSGEIAEDYTYYFAKSEQTPSVVSLGVFVKGEDCRVESAGGLIIQLLPYYEEEDVDWLEKRIENLRYMSDYLNEGKSLEDILDEIFTDAEAVVTDRKELRYSCDCSMEKIEKVVMALGRGELERIIEEDHGIELMCHFCHKKYRLDEKRLRELMENA